MLSNHKIQMALEEIKDIARMEMALYNESGKLLAATFRDHDDFETVVVDFVSSMAESQTLADSHFFKVMVDGEVHYILVVKSSTEEAYMVGKLAVCQIRHLAEAYREQFDRNNFMQNILLGNLLIVDMYNKARKFHIEQVERVVFVIEVESKKDAYIMELVKSMFGASAKDFVIEIDEQSIIVVKDVSELSDEGALEKVAEMMVDNLHSEAMVRVRVGYGNRVKNLQDIAKSYQEAKMAIEVGKILCR